jgi:hypothetical protein
VLFLILLIFTVFKFQHLHYAFFWDESSPYAIAIREMYNHGPSLLPNSINTNLSKGHPLFFHASAAI